MTCNHCDTLVNWKGKDVSESIRSVAKTLVPDIDVSEDKSEVSTVTGGLTNHLMLLKCQRNGSSFKLLFRLFGAGTENIIDRDAEHAALNTMAAEGLGVPVYGTFANGYCYGFIEGAPASIDDCLNPKIQALVGEELARWHAVEILDTESGASGGVVPYMRKLLKLVPSSFDDPTRNSLYKECVDLEAVRAGLDRMEAVYTKLVADRGVVFSHGDLLPANIIIHPGGEGVSFIDLEYCGSNHRAWDFGNHACEMMGWLIDKPYPSHEQMKPILSAYLKGCSKSGEVTEEEFTTMEAETFAFMPASLMLWGIWCLLQEKNSDIEGAKYLESAVARFNAFAEHENAAFSPFE